MPSVMTEQFVTGHILAVRAVVIFEAVVWDMAKRVVKAPANYAIRLMQALTSRPS